MRHVHPRNLTGLLPQPFRFPLRSAIFHGDAGTHPLCLGHVRDNHAPGSEIPVLVKRRDLDDMGREADRCPICHTRDSTRPVALHLDLFGALDRPSRQLLRVARDFDAYLWLARYDWLIRSALDIDGTQPAEAMVGGVAKYRSHY